MVFPASAEVCGAGGRHSFLGSWKGLMGRWGGWVEGSRLRPSNTSSGVWAGAGGLGDQREIEKTVLLGSGAELPGKMAA